MRLNVLALHDLTTAAVGALVRRGRGAILDVSSVGAFQPVPGSASYGQAAGTDLLDRVPARPRRVRR